MQTETILWLVFAVVIIIMLADKFVPGIKIESFLWAFVFSLILSALSTVLNKLEKKWSL